MLHTQPSSTAKSLYPQFRSLCLAISRDSSSRFFVISKKTFLIQRVTSNLIIEINLWPKTTINNWLMTVHKFHNGFKLRLLSTLLLGLIRRFLFTSHRMCNACCKEKVQFTDNGENRVSFLKQPLNEIGFDKYVPNFFSSRPF